MKQAASSLSVVIPVFNEAAGLAAFHMELKQALNNIPDMNSRIIYCDDGSTDGTLQLIQDLCCQDLTVSLLRLTRNFGKEIALTAGLQAAQGDAVITLDGDGQHPVGLIPKFIECWRNGSNVVIGVRSENQTDGLLKRFYSKLFYWIFNRFSTFKLRPGATDFRLIDHAVQQEYARLTERNRITRGLVDWLGYEPAYIEFKAEPRLAGKASYST